MQVRNFIQINDWDVRSFFAVILGIQALCLLVVILGTAGFQLPIIRQLITLIYLTFVPGYVLLRVLKMHKLGNIETPLYAVGLSVTVSMIAGLCANVSYPALGISQPLTTSLLLGTMTAIVIILCAACYLRDRDFDDYDYVDVAGLTSVPALCLFLLPFLSIFGSSLFTVYNNNILALSSLVLIAAVIILIGFDKFIPRALYPVAIFSIAISLLYGTSLVSMHIWGWDIQAEYYFSSRALTNAYWDAALPDLTNGVLSTVILGPLYANIGKIDLVWVFKAVYPSLFAFVPLGMYAIFKKQMKDKIAVLSVLFFMSFFGFYTDMPQLARQEVAELFLILLVIVMLATNINRTAKMSLLLLFAFSLIVSHYALSYLSIFFLAGVFVLYKLSGTSLAKKIVVWRWHGESDRIINNQSTDTSNLSSIAVSLNYLILFFIGSFAWYVYASGGLAVMALIDVSGHIANSLFVDFLNPATNQIFAISQTTLPSPLHDLARYMYYIASVLIVIGVISFFVFNRGAMKCYKEYAYLCMTSFLLLVLSVTIPFFASALNAARIYEIALLFLAPFFVIGWIQSIKVLRSHFVRKRRAPDKEVAGSLQAVSIFIAIFLLFNTGLIYEVLNDYPTSVWLNSGVDFPIYDSKEIEGANWLASTLNRPIGTGTALLSGYPKILADDYRVQVLKSVGLLPLSLDRATGVTPASQYVYLGTDNIVHRQVRLSGVSPIYVDSGNTTKGLSRIFDDGGSEIYY